jgi:hypothetical protein
LFYAQKGYTFEFDSTQGYFTGCEVIDPADGNKYRCIADVAAEGGSPSEDTAHWERIFNESAFFYRMPSVTYTVGDVKYAANLPSWGFLTCITGGVAGSGELVIPVGAKAGDTITDGQVVWRLDSLANMKKAFAESTGYGIVSGCEPTISGLTVTVGAGIVHLADGTRKELSATNITLDNADPTNPRIDLVYITSDGTVAKITGTAAASPVVPAVPTSGISVCNVTIAAGATTGTVTDSRGMLARYYNTGIVNVKDFGAKGDGVADDTAAIQAAIDYAKNNYVVGNPWDISPNGFVLKLIIPAGRYIISSTINVPSNVSICGAGASDTKFISAINDGSAIISVGAAEVGSAPVLDAYHNVIVGISIHGRNLNCIGIMATGGFGKFEDVSIAYCANYGLLLYEYVSSSFKDIRLNYCGSSTDDLTAIKLTARSNGTGFGCHACTFINCDFGGYNKQTNIIYIGTSNCVTFYGCQFQSGIKAITLEAHSASCSISGCYFENDITCFYGEFNTTNITGNFVGSNTEAIRFSSMRGCSINANLIDSNDADSFIQNIDENYIFGGNIILNNYSPRKTVSIKDELYYEKGTTNTISKTDGKFRLPYIVEMGTSNIADEVLQISFKYESGIYKFIMDRVNKNGTRTPVMPVTTRPTLANDATLADVISAFNQITGNLKNIGFYS